MEATTFLGALLGFIALLLVMFLYMHRKWCFSSHGGFPCCDENALPSKYIHKMGKFDIIKFYDLNVTITVKYSGRSGVVAGLRLFYQCLKAFNLPECMQQTFCKRNN